MATGSNQGDMTFSVGGHVVAWGFDFWGTISPFAMNGKNVNPPYLGNSASYLKGAKIGTHRQFW